MFANLLVEMKRNKISQANVAKTLGITTRGLSKKLSGGDFKSEEMIKIQETFFPDIDLKTLFTKT